MATFMWCSSPLPWIFSLTFFFLTIQLFAAPLSYSDHCASFVPQATPELYSIAATTLPFYQHTRGYYSGGDPILKDSSSSSFTFQTQAVQKTDVEGVVKVDADLVFMLSENGGFTSGPDTGNIFIPQPGTVLRSSDDQTRRRESISFKLEGFWSASSGRLCMVGSSYVTGEGYDVDEDLKLKAVLKLNNVYTSSSITNLITGTLEGLSSNFDPISMLMFPQKNYSYSLLAPQEIRDLSKVSVNLNHNGFCSMLDSWYDFHLKYAEDSDSASPFEGSNLLPSMVPNVMGCDCGGTQLRVLLQFSNRSSSNRRSGHSVSFKPKTALVGEGFWDEKENLLRFDACRISVPESLSLSDASVEDCSISFNFRFPTVWSIKERDSIVGEITSKRSPTDSGYFSKITARRTSGFRPYSSDKKYEYSQIDRVRELCPDKNQSGSSGTYPNWYSNELSFQMSVETPRGKKIGEGRSSPLFVGDQVYQQQYYRRSKNNDAPIIQGKPSKDSKLRMSYTMTLSRSGSVKLSSGSTIFNGTDLSLGDGMEISAEGVYEGSTGSLCMIGCRSLVDSMDCEILIKFQFPPLDYAKKGRDSIKGSIESLRKRSDPLYFDTLKAVSTMPLYEQTARSIWKLDSKLTLVLVSSTLSCIFAAWQLFHVKKHPHVVPFASQLMLIVLILGHAIPLMLNYDGSFQDNRFGYFREEERWIQTSEVLVRVATLLALLFEFCLLQLSFSATRRNSKSSVAEKKAIFLILPLYALGLLAAIFISRNYANNSIWDASKGFAGLVHGGFLLPQILVNIFRNSRDKILSVPFYIGTTLIRVMPYGYYLWKNGSCDSISGRFSEGSYPFGTAWDVIITLGSLLFAAIVYLQQRFGGRCFVPRRFRIDSVADEKVPLIS